MTNSQINKRRMELARERLASGYYRDWCKPPQNLSEAYRVTSAYLIKKYGLEYGKQKNN